MSGLRKARPAFAAGDLKTVSKSNVLAIGRSVNLIDPFAEN
jgi:hypothetical protein